MEPPPSAAPEAGVPPVLTDLSRLLIESVPAGILFVDTAGRVVLANPAAHEILGLPPGEVDLPLHEDPRLRFTTPDGQPIPPERRIVPWVLRTGRTVREQRARLLRSDGHEAILSVGASPLLSGGRTVGVVVTFADVTTSEDARRRAEADEARLRALVAQLPAYVWTTDDQLVLTSHVGSRRDPRDPRPGQHLTVAFEVSPDSPAVHHHRRALAGEPTGYEHELQGRCFKVSVEPLRRDDCTVEGVVGVSVDVTDLQRAEAAERHLAALVASADTAILSVGLDGTVRSWNAGAERLYGFTAEDMVGTPIRRLFPDPLPDHEPDTTGVWQGARYSFETVRRHASGCLVDVHISVSPIHDSDGRVSGASIVARDISEQVRAQRALATSEARFRSMAERSQDGVYLVSVPGLEVEYLNPAFERITGLSEAQLRADPGLIVRHTHRDDRASGRFERAAEDTEPFSRRFRWRRPDGDSIWLEEQRTPVLEDGQVVGIQGIIRDISAQEESERALRDALVREAEAVRELHELDELKTAFLQAVSHELRTPLTAVMGLAHTIEQHVERLEPDRLVDLSGRLRRNAHRLDRLLSDLLDLERLSRREFQPELQATELATVVADAVAMVDVGARQVATHLAPVAAEVEPRLVERIVENLVRNATRHTPPGSRIEVHLEADEDGVLLRVDDDGPGVPQAERDRIFEAFAQGAAARRSASPGTGIGLSLVARFARLQDGRAWVDASPSGGASFRVWLPRRIG